MSEPRQDPSILAANTGDQPASRKQDRLGFEPYVTAMAKFLTNPATRGPLTISVEGEWGGGKSSFMKQLREKLQELAADPRRPNTMPLTLEFNAWRHDKAEALWAAFAIEFTRGIKKQINRWRQIRGGVLLLYYRYQWNEGWLDLARAIVMWAAIVAGAVYGVSKGWTWLDGKEFSTLGRVGLGLAGLAGFLKGLAKLVDRIGNPLEMDLAQFVRKPEYEKNVSFVEKFHEDFSKIIRAYAGAQTVYIFIDDLDRCEVPKAAELMQALNLMMSSEQEKLVFILGMDREKVAAGLAVKHKEVLSFLGGGEGLDGLQFGYDFIEKFVQIPFSVPIPDKADVEHYLEELSKPPSGVVRRTTWADRVSVWIYGDRRRVLKSILQERAGESTAQAAAIDEREQANLRVTEDSLVFRATVLALARALNNNPRRLKQFVNLFRLRWYIAHETGLFDGQSRLTPEKIGTFVAFQVGYPLLVADLARSPELIDDLRVKNNTKPIARRWLTQEGIVRLMQVSEEWELTQADVRKLMRVSPRVRTIEESPLEPQNAASGAKAATQSSFDDDDNDDDSESLSDSAAPIESGGDFAVWLHSALWGTGPEKEAYVDVTDILRGYLNRGVQIRASNEYFSDPYPGKPKHLFVTYSHGRDGAPYALTFQENALIDLPERFLPKPSAASS